MAAPPEANIIQQAYADHVANAFKVYVNQMIAASTQADVKAVEESFQKAIADGRRWRDRALQLLPT